MQIRQQYKVFENTNTPLSYEIDFTRSDILKIQISGDGDCSIKVYGKIDKTSDYSLMPIIQDIDYDFIDKIIKKGVYTVSATGYYRLKLEVESLVDTLKCVANEVVEV